jgi:molybdate transport system substrate-binding protein
MRRAVLAVIAMVGLAGCSSSGSDGGGGGGGGTSSGSALSGSITVDSAASLTEAFDTIKAQFAKAHPGTTITVRYGASSDLSTQITQGDKVDVFASASSKNMDSVVSAGLATNPTDFVSNTLEIAVPPNNPGKITALADLAKSRVKVAVCAAAVPCGVVAAEVFANAGLTVHAVADEADVKSTLAVVESGEVDAGLVYVTDVRAAGDKVKGIAIPDSVNASTVYPIVALTDSGNAALAQAFVDYVLSDAGRQVLVADGFHTP